ncbi:MULTISPECIES: hypothetical protein [unclassified Spirosoma]|uniref:hypothetical protein n=1 Tax=unclassified Spirosoma TaxID=2621999 RepID=UPI0009625291|nr:MULTISPECIES: hypothetical protein [unclassified Spirosoma]MBN8824836.1 hypothetical protein [Spirosoma sp.]OJW77015.1 MAG: hypothetical protein BGO59_23470 [Spirosoma sp. 48-14]
MKKIIFALVIISLGTGPCIAQERIDATLATMQMLLQQTSLPASATVIKPLAKAYAIQINNHVFPLQETTHLDWSKSGKGAYQVEFFLQKGTAITDATDPGFRRAYWKIPLSSKQACQKFIALFDSLRTEMRRG